MKNAFFKEVNLYIGRLLLISMLIISLPQGYAAAAQDPCLTQTSNLSPRITSLDFNAIVMFYSNALKSSVMPFGGKFLDQSVDMPQIYSQLKYLNSLYVVLSTGKEPAEDLIEYILKDEQLTDTVNSIILAQDRMQETPYGVTIDREWAEKYKYHVLAKAIATLDDWHFFFMQMEYEFSIEFLDNFKRHLMQNYLMNENSIPYEERKERAKRLAVYATGQLAKLQMAGGLGSFKPDMVRGGFYKALKKYWGAEKTRNHLHVMGVFYAKAIKGEGELVFDRDLNPVVESIRQVKGITPEQAYEKVVAKESELVDVAIETMEEVVTYKDIEINMNGVGKVDVTIYRNTLSEMHEYWMYCPEVFHEAYPGDANDGFRTVQTFLYREVSMRYLQYLAKENKIGKKVVISNSETSTALANPIVINRDLERYPVQQRERYEKMFEALDKLEIIYHHYNHTIVPAGMGTFPPWKFNDLKIDLRYLFITEAGKLDLQILVGEISNLLTGCSSMHTGIMREDEGLYKFYAHKIVEDGLFGNSEGSDVDRWQGREILAIIKIFMERLKVDTAESLFRELDKDSDMKRDFITAMKVVKKIQKQRFIDELFDGTFGEIDVSREELEKDGIDLLNRPFFTFVRRMVPYKCSNMIVDMLEDKAYRERIIKSKAVIIIGGRKFDDFSESQHRRIQELIKQDPRLRSNMLFISNHNVATSWLIQQGTDNGGMLSWEGMEAGPTSPGNAGLNWAAAFSVLDGVMAERTIPIKRDENGKVFGGTGYVVAYGKERVDNRQKSRLPSKESIMEKMEESSRNYFQGEDHDAVCFNNMRLNMTQGDILTQASGLIRNTAKAIQKKEQKQQNWDRVIEEFAGAQSGESIENILYNGENGAHDFYFGKNWPREKSIGGLDNFVESLRINIANGNIYKEGIDMVTYLITMLKNKKHNRSIFKIVNAINGTLKQYSPLTYYEKQKELLAFLEKLVLRLKQGNNSLNDGPDIVCQDQDIPVTIDIERSI